MIDRAATQARIVEAERRAANAREEARGLTDRIYLAEQVGREKLATDLRGKQKALLVEAEHLDAEIEVQKAQLAATHAPAPVIEPQRAPTIASVVIERTHDAPAGDAQAELLAILGLGPPAPVRSPPPSPVAAPIPMKQVGPYEVRGVLGEGGMGRVYRVHHPGWAMDLAMKVPLGNVRPAQRKRIVDEAQAWSALGLHPHVVTCYFALTVEGVPWIFAELVEGGSLRDWIERRDLYACAAPLARLLDVAIETALGLHHAHDRGLIHQDMKPANVLMTRDAVAKVTDFGLARAALSLEGVGSQPPPPVGSEFRRGPPPRGAARQSGSRLAPLGSEHVRPSAPATMVVDLMGMTPAYASPEQVRAGRGDASARITRRSDLWSWALTVLETFTGDLTWSAGPMGGEALRAYRPKDGLPAMPAALASLLARCFAPDEPDRPKTMLACAEEIRALYEPATGRAVPPARKAYYDGAGELYNRGASLEALGALDDASACFERALAIDPQHFRSVFARTMMRWRGAALTDVEAVRHVEEAREMVKLRARAPHASREPKADADELLAWLHAERGANGGAERLMDEARATGGRVPPSAARLAHELRCGIRPGKMLKSHARPIAYALAGDGVQLAAIGADEHGAASLLRWDLDAGRARQRVPLPPDEQPIGVAIARDGREVVLWSTSCAWIHDDGAIALRPIGDAERNAWLARSMGPARVVEERTDREGRVLLEARDTDTGAVRWTCATFEPSACLAVSADGEVVVTVARDGTFRRWDGRTGRCVMTAPMGYALPPVAAMLSASGHRVAMVDAERKLHGYALELALPRAAFPVEPPTRSEELLDRQHALESALSELDALIVSSPALAVAKLDDIRRAPWATRLPEVRARWERLATRCAKGGVIAAWPSLEIRDERGAIVGVELSPQGDRVLSACAGARDVWVWDARTGACLQRLAHGLAVSAVSVVTLASSVAIAGGNRVGLWDLATGASVGALVADGDVTRVALSPNGRRVALAVGARITVHDVSSGARVRAFSADYDVRRLALDADGDVLMVASATGLRRYRLDSGDAVTPLVFPGARDTPDVAVSPCGRWVLSGSADGTLRFWSGDGVVLNRATSEAAITGVAMTHDRRVAVTVDERGQVALWDFPSAQRIAVLSGHSRAVTDVALTPSGRTLATGGIDGTVRVWTLEWTLDPTLL